MKILVTGGGGQLASALFDAARATDHDLRMLSLDELDITDAAAVRRILDRERPAAVVNAAAYTAVDRAEEEEELATRINGDSVGGLASACVESGARIVQVSTDFVFDGAASRPIGPAETPRPLSAYGRSKLVGEERCREHGGDSWLIVRTAWLYGSGHQNFVSTMLRLMRDRTEIGVVADQIGTPTWTGTLASGILRLIDRGASGIHHLTDSGVATWYDFAVAIQEVGRGLGLLPRACVVRPISTSEYPTPAIRPCYSVLDKAKTFEILDGPTPHWRSGLVRCLEGWVEP